MLIDRGGGHPVACHFAEVVTGCRPVRRRSTENSR